MGKQISYSKKELNMSVQKFFIPPSEDIDKMKSYVKTDVNTGTLYIKTSPEHIAIAKDIASKFLKEGQDAVYENIMLCEILSLHIGAFMHAQKLKDTETLIELIRGLVTALNNEVTIHSVEQH